MQALTLLGRVELIQEDYLGATATLEKAVDADSGYWMAHNLLADAYLKQKKYEGARQQAELAMAQGKGGASAANLVLGQALVNLGKKEEGIRALKTFVHDSPKNPAVPQVRDLIATLGRTRHGSCQWRCNYAEERGANVRRRPSAGHSRTRGCGKAVAARGNR